VLGVLIEIFGGNSVVGDRGFPRKADVTLEYLKSAAADLDVGAVAVEGLIMLRTSRRLLERPVSVIARGWTLT
jgi:hypothetical protein